MSKMARITVFLLISLALIAATSVSVQGWLGAASHPTTGVHNVGGLQTNFNHQRSTAAELQNSQLQSGQPASGSHQGGCHSNPIPQD
jgi:hypothetical protein